MDLDRFNTYVSLCLYTVCNNLTNVCTNIHYQPYCLITINNYTCQKIIIFCSRSSNVVAKSVAFGPAPALVLA